MRLEAVATTLLTSETNNGHESESTAASLRSCSFLRFVQSGQKGDDQAVFRLLENKFRKIIRNIRVFKKSAAQNMDPKWET